MGNLLWNDEQYKSWILSRPFDELKAGFWEREHTLQGLRLQGVDPSSSRFALQDSHDSAVSYITALEAALEKARGPYKGDTILVTQEIVAFFRERGSAEGWIEQWTESRFATLRDKHSRDPVWWVAVNDAYQCDIPDSLVKPARLAYVEYMTTP